MRRIIPISLLLIFIPCMVGYYYVYLTAKYLNYYNIQQQIYSEHFDKKLSLLKINPVDEGKIQWKKNGKEFELKGQLYDVVSCKREKDTIYMYCYHDIKEKDLNTGLKNQKAHGSLGIRISVKILEVNSIEPLYNRLQYPEGQSFTFIHFSGKIISVISDIHSPPPKQILFS